MSITVPGMVSVATRERSPKPGNAKPVRLVDGLEERINAIVDAINRQSVGATANRSTVIRDALKGGGLADLERRYGIEPPTEEK